jgi:hypothetical protein
VAINQIWVDRGTRFSTDSKFVGSFGGEIVDKSVCRFEQTIKYIPTAFEGKVEANTSFSMAIGNERATRTPADKFTGGISSGRLYLDDLGTELGEDMGGKGRCKH